MPRRPLPIGTWGNISTVQVARKRCVARARFRDHDGVTRKVEAWGTSKAGAEAALRQAMTERVQDAGADLEPATRVAALADLWLREEVDGSDLSVNTKSRYRSITMDKVVPVAGSLMLRELTVRRLSRIMDRLTEEHGAATANLCRSVLVGMCKYAVTAGGMATNPMRDIAARRSEAPEVRALDVEEVRAIRAALRADKRAVRADLPVLVDVLLGTGCRIGEAAALRVEDLDLEDGLVWITGTVIRSKATGLIRQDTTKGRKPRPIRLPVFTVAALREHLDSELVDSSQGVVFPTAKGGLREVSTLNWQWRKFRERNPRWDWTSFHTFRKTVATAVQREHGLEVASEILGHAASQTTADRYVEMVRSAHDVRSTLDRFAS